MEEDLELELSNICAKTIHGKYYRRRNCPVSFYDLITFFEINKINTRISNRFYNIMYFIDKDIYELTLIPLKGKRFRPSMVDVTELIYFTAFNTIHIANKLKRERIRIKEHFRTCIKETIECLPGGSVYQECEDRFNQLQSLTKFNKV